MIKLIATDLDGTLADHEGKIPKDAYKVIDELHKRGIAFVVATGRQTATVENDFAEVLDKIYVVTENGGVVRQNKKDISFSYLDGEKVKEAIQAISQIEGIEFVVCCKDKAYQNTNAEVFNKELDKYYHSREQLNQLEDIDTIKDEVIKIAIYEKDDVNKIIVPYVQNLFGETFKLTVSGQNWLDMGHMEVNKGKAIGKIMEVLGLEKDECMAFGDYFNDVEMLQQVTHSYAMEHAPDGVKCHASNIAPVNGVLDIIGQVNKLSS